jgi:protein SCO1/2
VHAGADRNADGDRIEEAPKEMRGVAIVDQLGAELPRDVEFTESTGAKRTLGEFLGGDLPVVLTFNYSNCPMLCSMQLSSLVTALAKLELKAGVHYQIVTIGLDPKETPEKAAETKGHYIERFSKERQPEYAKGWHFLVGPEANVRKVADAVGFGYRYVPARKEYAHQTALIMVSPLGKVTQYVKGIQYKPEVVEKSIVNAGMNRQSVSLGYALSCFYYQNNAGKHTKSVWKAMRLGAFGFLVFLLGGFGAWQVLRRRKNNMESPHHDSLD